MQMLPPPWCFNGPFVSIDLLMESLSKFGQNGRMCFIHLQLIALFHVHLISFSFQNDFFPAPSVNPKVKLENGSMFGMHRVEDIKKEFYQLLNTTTDPNIVSFLVSYVRLMYLRLSKIHFIVCVKNILSKLGVF